MKHLRPEGDPDGNKVELWQPMAWDARNKEA